MSGVASRREIEMAIRMAADTKRKAASEARKLMVLNDRLTMEASRRSMNRTNRRTCQCRLRVGRDGGKAMFVPNLPPSPPSPVGERA